MNDFDFEELDKAVGALADKTRQEHGLMPQLARPVTGSAVELQATKPTSLVQPPQTEKPVELSASQTSPAPAIEPKRRLDSSRPRPRAFMDIVPPAATRKAPARVGVSIQPVSKIEEISSLAPADNPIAQTPEHSGQPATTQGKMQYDEPAAMPPIAETQPEPQTQSARVEQSPKPAADEHSWPDPLDFALDTPQAIESSQADTPSKSPDYVSPFLAEAKVEKRPLGAFSSFRPAEAPSDSQDMPPLEESTPQSQSDSLQSTETAPEPIPPEKAPLPPRSSEPAAEEQKSPDIHSAAMMSIPQQYRSEQKIADTSPRPIFDTKEYHPPLLEATTHDHHRSGMWGKIFIAFVVLAILAAATYFAYAYFVQQ